MEPTMASYSQGCPNRLNNCPYALADYLVSPSFSLPCSLPDHHTATYSIEPQPSTLDWSALNFGSRHSILTIFRKKLLLQLFAVRFFMMSQQAGDISFINPAIKESKSSENNGLEEKNDNREEAHVGGYQRIQLGAGLKAVSEQIAA